jgi:VIT1/CCC1 family predicted Fe2+/Mn2+ transporter
LISIQTEIPTIQGIVYFIAAVVPIYLIFIMEKNGSRNNNFKNLLIVLAVFIIMQGIYHSVGALGFSLLAKGILEPLSFGILILFAVFYLHSKRRTKNEEKVKVA